MTLPEQPVLKHWLDRAWKLTQGRDHPLGTLAGERLGETTALVLLGPKNRFGATYFQLFLLDARNQVGEPAVIIGLHGSGPYPSYNWVEIISLAPEVAFASAGHNEAHVLNVRGAGLDHELLGRLADLIPPGGHVMIEYDSPHHAETARGLSLGVPPAVTPLGYLLHSIGCGAGFRDWYIAEGGSEGPRKLQGYKPLDEAHARQNARELAAQLLAFLEKPPSPDHADVEGPARQRAADLLSRMDIAEGDLRQAIERAVASQPNATDGPPGHEAVPVRRQ